MLGVMAPYVYLSFFAFETQIKQWTLSERAFFIRERLGRGEKVMTSFAFENAPPISLSSKLVPILYREYEYGLYQRFYSL